ncbi:unnamed protein product [Calypogeia fissa]
MAGIGTEHPGGWSEVGRCGGLTTIKVDTTVVLLDFEYSVRVGKDSIRAMQIGMSVAIVRCEVQGKDNNITSSGPVVASATRARGAAEAFLDSGEAVPGLCCFP